MANFGIIIVFYNPTEYDIDNVVFLSKDYVTIVVDNSDKASSRLYSVDSLVYIPLNGNRGIAEAQNIGIRQMLQSYSSIKHVIFLDQDSRFDPCYPKILYNEFLRLNKIYPTLAILGPKVINADTGKEYKSLLHKDKAAHDSFVQKREIISSGSCAALDVLVAVGMFESDLFIDYVDFEMCWRLASKGYISGISNTLEIRHTVGKKYISLGPYKDIISAPFRYYYQYRNLIWLIGRSYVPSGWKINNIIKSIFRLPILWLFYDRGAVRYAFKGFYHGFTK